MDNNKIIINLLYKVEKDILNLNDKINNLEDSIDKINSKIETEIKTDCKKMSEHIDFIENVYNNIKKPLNYMCNILNNQTISKYINL
jgi:hypothetical protein